MRISITLMVVLMLLFWGMFFVDSKGKQKKFGTAITERDSLPAMSTLGVTTFVSDSGITRYKIITEQWDIYDRKTPSYWAFEKGIYLEKFDSVFKVEAMIKADTAYFYDTEKLWKLTGHVDITNTDSVRLQTELLFWDQQNQKIYSDKWVSIRQPDRISFGIGFESDQQMMNPKIFNLKGDYYIDEHSQSLSPDSIATDSIAP